MGTKVAFVFPGQGSQSMGMCDALLRDFPAVAQRFEQAADILGYDIGTIIAHGPADKLDQTETTQPAMLVAAVATWDAWIASGGAKPAFMAGHSFGEYSALVCANAIRFEDAVFLAAARGRYMQEAVPAERGAVRAILGLEEDVLSALCARAAAGQVVCCANLNAPGQIVITGDREAVERASDLATKAGARKVIPLAVSAPVHCALMLPAAERLAGQLAGIEIEMPAIPVIHNVDARPRDTVDGIREALIDQMASPVRWRDTIDYFATNGVGGVVECGPGKVLSALVRRTCKQIETCALRDRMSIDAAIGKVCDADFGGNDA
jgi:[acyl-carrier-protein] S-malonyltransferase